MKEKNENSPKSLGHSKSNSKRKFIAMQDYLEEQEQSHINNLILYLQELEKEE